MSMMSVSSSINRFSVMSRAHNDWQQQAEPSELPKNWDEDPKKPANWKLQKKVINTAIASSIAFAYVLALSVYSAATSVTVTSLGLSQELSLAPYSAFALGLVFGPSFATPFEKRYGRKAVLLFTIPFFALIMIGAGASKNAAGLIVCRFLSAFFAAPGLFLTYAIVSDIWVSAHQSLAIGLFAASLVLGVSAGPIVGGVVVFYENWRWTQWVTLFAVIILMFAAIGMSESHKETLIRRGKTPEQLEREELERKEKNLPPEMKGVFFKGNMMFGSSLRMLATIPALGMSSVYVAYTFAVILVLPVVIPAKFGTLYNFNEEQQGLVFAGMCAGLVVAVGFIFVIDRFIHQPRVKHWEDVHDPLNEKGDVEMTDGGDGPFHTSWRKGLAVSTRNLGARDSNTTNQTDATRNNSASSRDTRRTSGSHERSNRRLSGSSRKSRLQAFSEKNINIAIAATRHLNSNAANANKKIIVERVMVLLKNNESFTDICDALVKLGMEFEEALLAKVLVDALEKEKGGNDIPLARSKSLHRQAAQAALMGSSEASDTITPLESPVEEPKLQKPECPPPEWRFLPSLLATFFFPGGLILCAWTAKADVSYIIPTIGLGLVGFGATLINFSATSYAMELHDETSDDAIRARAGATILTFVLATAFPLFVMPMYKALGFEWATSVFGFVGLVLGAVPWVITFKGDSLRGKQAEAN